MFTKKAPTSSAFFTLFLYATGVYIVICSDCTFSKRCQVSFGKDDSERALTLCETASLYNAVLAHEQKYPTYMPDYAIELALITGMRVGELAALRWTDIDENFIHIDHSEHCLPYKDKPSELIIGEPKNGKHRLLPLTEDAIALLEKIKSLHLLHKDDFIFVRENGTRYSAHDISCAASRRAAEAGIPKTSIHGIRRTVSSLLNKEIHQREVASMLGHSEKVNEQCYNYSTAEYKEKADALRAVSSKVINFKL